MPCSSHHCNCRGEMPVNATTSLELNPISQIQERMFQTFLHFMFETFYGEVVRCQLNLPVERIQGVNTGLAASRRRRSGQSPAGRHLGARLTASVRGTQSRDLAPPPHAQASCRVAE